MALFEAYTKPGVYVRESIEDAGIPLFGVARVPVLIGEGEETRKRTSALHRGSSTYADEQVVRENITDQVTGLTRKFKLNYFPVVLGDGKGTVTNAPQDIKVYANDLPILVSSLKGSTGEFQTQNLLPKGTDLRVDYYFKRTDTEVLAESLSSQVPGFASVALSSGTLLNVTCTTPGAVGNYANVTVMPVVHEYTVAGMKITITGTPLTDGFLFDTPKVTLKAPAASAVATYALNVLDITPKTSGTLAEIVTAIEAAVLPAGLTVSVSYVAPLTGASTYSAPGTLPVGAPMTLVSYSDALAVQGQGSNDIKVYLAKSSGVRSHKELAALINSGAFTTSAGSLVATSTEGTVDLNTPSLLNIKVPTTFYLAGGYGPSTNKTFTVANFPIVDGSNGGVVSTSPKDVKVTVNGVLATVASVDGSHGQFTLVNPVASGSDLRASYFYNTFQDTFDILPGDNIVELISVGYGEGRSDFIDGVDFVLETDSKGGAVIQWGASTSVKAIDTLDNSTPFTMPVTPTIVDERMFLRPVSGAVNGINRVFTLEDTPTLEPTKVTDGSQRGKLTNDPSHILVYCGVDPTDALTRSPLRVVSLDGATKTITLFNPPPVGQSLFATYWRSALNDHTYTLEVKVPGVTGQGTYTIKNEFGDLVPKVTMVSENVASAAFSNTGIVWPFAFSDMRTQVGATAPSETITVTFEDTGNTLFTTLPTQAYNDTVVPGLVFYATTYGTDPNGVTTITLRAQSATPDASAITVSGETVTIDLLKGSGQTRTIGDVLNLFSTSTATTPKAGKICCKLANSNVVTTNAVLAASDTLDDGATFTGTAEAVRFKVTSNRTAADYKLDGYGITEGTGYLGQTFVSHTSGVQFTICDPMRVAYRQEYGHQSSPTPSYSFAPGDSITFTVDTLARTTSAIPVIDVPGVRLKVTSTYGMSVGNTSLLTTYNKSGAEPKVGDFYSVSYRTAKTDKDYKLKIFTNVSDIYAEYGTPTATNKLSLAAKLFTQNGGGLVGCIQVPKQLGMETASDQSFMSAIEYLARPLPGSENKAGLIVPLTTSPTVLQMLNRHLINQSSQRMGGEAIAYVGFGIEDTPNDARKITRAIKSDRVIAIYPGGAVLNLDVNGRAVEFAVGGEFLAAAAAGMDMSPSIDLATSLTRKGLVGFDRLVERYDDAIMDLAAADGVCWLLERSGSLQFRHYITTDPSNPIKREPTNRKVADAVRTRLRRNLDQFIARKVLSSLTSDISIVVHQTLKSMMGEELVAQYTDVVVEPDSADDTVIHVSLKFKPISSLMWLDVNLTVTQKM